MINKLIYKAFIGTVAYSSDDELFYGKIDGINDLVTFEGSSVSELKKAFEDSVDEYIDLCQELGKDVSRSFKGSFNVRVKPELHARAYQNAVIQGKTLNQFIQEAIELKLNTLPKVFNN